MNEDKFPTLELIACISTTCIAVFVLWLLFPELKSEGPATWLTAFANCASAAAIVWIFFRQASREDRSKRYEKAERLKSILFIVQDVRLTIGDIQKRISYDSGKFVDSFLDTERVAAELAEQSLSTIPLTECRSPGAISNVLAMRRVVRQLVEMIADNDRFSVERREDIIKKLNDMSQQALGQLRCIDAVFQLALAGKEEDLI
jgi:hypothetical protein